MRFAVWILAAISVAIAALALWLGRGSIEILLRADRVPGEVIAVDGAAGADPPAEPTLAVRYTGLDREPHQVAIPQARAGAYGPGDRVEVWRLPGEPPRAEPVDFALQWERSIVLFVLAWIFGWIARLLRMSEAADGDPAALVGTGFVALFGGPLLAGGIAIAAVDAHLLATGVRTTGEWLGNGGVHLVTAEGRAIEVRDDDYLAAAFETGQRVAVVHRPGRPHAARVHEGIDYWLDAIILAAFGGVVTLVGVLSLWFARPTRRRR